MTATEVHTPIFRTWVRRIDSGVLTKSQIQQFARYPGGKSTNLTPDEHATLTAMLEARPVRLTDDHTRQGIEWLTRYGAKRVERLPAWAVERFSHFTYDGETYDIGTGGWPNKLPVWTIHTLDGRRVKYIANAWQDQRPYSLAWVIS